MNIAGFGGSFAEKYKKRVKSVKSGYFVKKWKNQLFGFHLYAFLPFQVNSFLPDYSGMFLISPPKGRLLPEAKIFIRYGKKILEDAVSISRRQVAFFAPPSSINGKFWKIELPV